MNGNDWRAERQLFGQEVRVAVGSLLLRIQLVTITSSWRHTRAWYDDIHFLPLRSVALQLEGIKLYNKNWSRWLNNELKRGLKRLSFPGALNDPVCVTRISTRSLEACRHQRNRAMSQACCDTWRAMTLGGILHIRPSWPWLLQNG